jgi:hypothetical protein
VFRTVIAGLAPAIHHLQKILRRLMDARVKPGMTSDVSVEGAFKHTFAFPRRITRE